MHLDNRIKILSLDVISGYIVELIKIISPNDTFAFWHDSCMVILSHENNLA